MTDEETRAIAYQDSIRARHAYRRAALQRLRGSQSAYQGLYNRTKALRGEIAQDDDREDEEIRGEYLIGNL